MGVVVHRPFDHDGDAQGHEGLREVQNLLSLRRDGQWGEGYVRLLSEKNPTIS